MSNHADHRTFLRDAAVATVTLFALTALLETGVRALVLPAYLLVVGFDLLEAAFGAVGVAYPVLFGAYLVGLGLLAATAARVARRHAPEGATWRFGVGGALGVVGALSLVFAGAVPVGTDQLDAVAISGGLGVALLSVAAWLLGRRPTWPFEPAT